MNAWFSKFVLMGAAVILFALVDEASGQITPESLSAQIAAESGNPSENYADYSLDLATLLYGYSSDSLSRIFGGPTTVFLSAGTTSGGTTTNGLITGGTTTGGSTTSGTTTGGTNPSGTAADSMIVDETTADETTLDGTTAAAAKTAAAAADDGTTDTTPLLNETLGLAPFNFPTLSSKLTSGVKAELDKVVQYLTENPDQNISIEGHVSEDIAIDMTLSENRANAARNYLISQGIDENRITAVGFGSSQPLVDGFNQPENRRIEIKLVP
ncbi:MAG: OmpA family protein [Verrucomicrobiae bacterium]|nr:OmpA family protein [Verrucomicrobiae bacterium]